jgi:hypothetical protein
LQLVGKNVVESDVEEEVIVLVGHVGGELGDLANFVLRSPETVLFVPS